METTQQLTHWRKAFKMYNEEFFGFHSFETGEKERNVTFVRFDTQTITVAGGNKETKTVAYVKDMQGVEMKPILWNPTNSQLTARALKTPNPVEWIGKTVTIWPDPTVTLGKKTNKVGGIRVRPLAPKSSLPGIAPDNFERMLAAIAAGTYTKEAAIASFSFTPEQTNRL